MPLSYSSLLVRSLLRQSLLPLLPWLYSTQNLTSQGSLRSARKRPRCYKAGHSTGGRKSAFVELCTRIRMHPLFLVSIKGEIHRGGLIWILGRTVLSLFQSGVVACRGSCDR